MAVTHVYALPVEQTQWHVPSGSTTSFSWVYDQGREKLLNLYEKGKRLQWNAADRIDWSLPFDPAIGLGGPEEFIPIYGSPIYAAMTEDQKTELLHNMVSWQFSQFLHGEQGALVCAAKIVQTNPDIESKYYCATQVMDEARHVEAYSRYLHEKVQLVYPINKHLQSLLNDTIQDSRWDITSLGMQVLIEGLALAAFGLIRDFTQDPLARSIVAYVMQDEARHVAFGRLSLRDHYRELSTPERDEREEFCIDACYLMRDRFLAEEMWEHLGLPVEECLSYVRTSQSQIEFRSLLFTRIVPILKDIGLWGPRIHNAFADMGVLGYESIDLDAVMAEDEGRADEMDRERAARAIEETVSVALAAG